MVTLACRVAAGRTSRCTGSNTVPARPGPRFWRRRGRRTAGSWGSGSPARSRRRRRRVGGSGPWRPSVGRPMASGEAGLVACVESSCARSARESAAGTHPAAWRRVGAASGREAAGKAREAAPRAPTATPCGTGAARWRCRIRPMEKPSLDARLPVVGTRPAVKSRLGQGQDRRRDER
jgi:hypothetical protein